MIDTPLFRITRLCITLVGAAGITAAALHPSPVEVAAAVGPTVPSPMLTSPIVPVSAAPAARPDPTTTTSPATTTTTTSAPTTVTTPPATAALPTATQTTQATTTTTTAPAPPAVATTRTPACASQLFQLVNDARSAAGVAVLTHDDTILPVPRDWAGHLGQTGELAHNPDYGAQIFSRQPRAMRAAENVGTGSTVRSVHERFMGSSTHRANIVDAGLSHAAIGCVTDGSGQLWAVVNFWGG